MDLIQIADVLALTGISRTTLWRWAKAGKLPAPKLVGGRSVRYVRAEILAWDQERKAAHARAHS